MATAIEARLLEVTAELKGHFSSSSKLAEHTGIPEWLVKETLDRLLIMLKIDKFDLITWHGTTQFYGLHRGVRPGQARIDSIMKTEGEQQ